MISPMMKVFILGANTTPGMMIQDIALVEEVHVIESNSIEKGFEALENKVQKLKEISSYLNDSKTPEPLSEGEVENVISLIDETLLEKNTIDKDLDNIEETIFLHNCFGQRSLETEGAINSSGLKITYILIPKSQKKLITKTDFILLGTTDRLIYGLYIGLNEIRSEILAFKVNLPTDNLNDLNTKFEELKNRKKLLFEKLNSFGKYKESLDRKVSELENKLRILKVGKNITSRGVLHYVEGWVLEEKIEEVERSLSSKKYGLVFSSPQEREEPPVQLKNSKWLQSCRPLYSLINSYPGYREQDVSFSFLAFTCLFFAILVGDAGYGLLTLSFTVFFSFKKLDEKYRDLIRLGWLFSFGAIIWGAVTGNWFGIKSLSEIPILESLIIAPLNAFDSNSQNNIILLCFIIGAAHISIAHLMKFISVDKNVSELGWIGVVWSVFLVVRNLVLETPVPAYMSYILVTSLVFIALFAKPQKNVFKRLFEGLASIPMKLMNCFSDTISYIRLFAVGMATLAVASSFNEIAFGIGFDSPFNALLASLILLMGHGVNIAMAALSVVVHGLRLNMLEFSSHLGIEWSGQLFKPLKPMGD